MQSNFTTCRAIICSDHSWRGLNFYWNCGWLSTMVGHVMYDWFKARNIANFTRHSHCPRILKGTPVLASDQIFTDAAGSLACSGSLEEIQELWPDIKTTTIVSFATAFRLLPQRIRRPDEIPSKGEGFIRRPWVRGGHGISCTTRKAMYGKYITELLPPGAPQYLSVTCANISRWGTLVAPLIIWPTKPKNGWMKIVRSKLAKRRIVKLYDIITVVLLIIQHYFRK